MPIINARYAEEYPPLNRAAGMNRGSRQGPRRGTGTRATPQTMPTRESREQQTVQKGSNNKGHVMVTLLPIEGAAVTLRQKLQIDKIDPTKYGVIKCINRQDGALIVTLSGAEEKKRFVSDLAGRQYNIQEEQYIPYEVRIHTLPEGVNENDVALEVRKRCGADPIKVDLIPYKETNNKHRGLSFAAISCNSAMYKELAATKGLSIWWQWCRIDATPRALKCKKCGVLGHTARHCKIDSVAAAFREDPNAKGQCIDCFIQNTINQGRKGYKVKDTRHKSSSESCPTQHSLARRRLRLWRKSERNAEIGNPIEHSEEGAYSAED